MKVKPFLIVLGIGTILALMHGAFTFTIHTLVSGLFNVYFFIVVYSLHELLKFEGEQVQTYQSAGSQNFGSYSQPDYEKGNGVNEFGQRPQPTAPPIY